MTTLDQQRAWHALEKVKSVADANNSKKWRSKYRSYVRSLPMNLMMQGLGQAIATEMAASSRGGNIGAAHEKLLDHVLDWLGKTWENRPYRLSNDEYNAVKLGIQFLDKLTQNDEASALRAQQELSAYLKWLKTFAEALLPADGNSPQGTGDDNDGSEGNDVEADHASS